MDDKTTQMMEQLMKNPAALRGLMQSRDGQTLMQMLTQGDRGAALQQAAQSAARGDPAALRQMIGQIMESPQGAELIQRINRAARK